MNTKLAINLLTEAGNNLTVTLAALGLLDNGETIKSLQQKVDQSIKAAFDKQLQLSSKLDIAEGKLQVADEALRLAVSHNTTEQERLLSLKKEQGQLQIAIKNLEDKKKILADNGNGDKGKIKQEIETIKGKINTTDAQIKDLTQKITDGLALVARYDNLIIQGNTAQNNANYHNQFVQRWDVVGYESGRSGKKKAIYGWVTNQEQVNLRDGYQNQANQFRAEANSIQGSVDDFNKNKSILQETKDSKNNELWLLYHELDAKNNLLSFVGTRSDNELALVNLQLDQGKEDLQQLEKTEIPSQEKAAQATNLKVTQAQSDLDKLKTDKLSAQKDLDNFVKDNKELLTTDLSLGLLKDAITKVQDKITSLKGDLAKPNQSATTIKGLNEAIAVEQGKLGQLKQQYQLLGLEALEINQGRLESFNQQQATETSVNDAVKLDTIEGYVVLLPQLVQQMTGLSDVWGENLKQNHGFTVEVNNLFQNNLTAFDGLTKYIGDKFAEPYSDYSLNKIQLDEAIAIQDTQVKYRDALTQAVDDLGENIALQKKAVEQADALSGKLNHIRDLRSFEQGYGDLQNALSKLASVDKADYEWADQKVKNIAQDLLNKLQGNEQYKLVADKLRLALNNYNSFAAANLQSYTNKYQGYIDIRRKQIDDVKTIQDEKDLKSQEAIRNWQAVRSDVTGNYYFLTPARDWSGAQAIAQSAGGNLVTINNQDEQNWLFQRYKSYVWIGLSDHVQEGVWRWVSGEPVTYTNWLPNQPDNWDGIEDFVQLNLTGDGRWNDLPHVGIHNQNIPGIVELNFQKYDQQIQAVNDKATADKARVAAELQSLHDQGIKVFIGQAAEALRPLLIDKVNEEVTNKIADLPNQIELSLPNNIFTNPANNHSYVLVTNQDTLTRLMNLGGYSVRVDDELERSWLIDKFGTESTSLAIQLIPGIQVQAVVRPLNEENPIIIEIDSQQIVDQKLKQQEQWIETNLQKYVEAKENEVIQTKEQQLALIGQKVRPSSALYFDGVNDYINAWINPSLEVSNTLTIEAWINPQKQNQVEGGIIVNREGEYEIAVWNDGTIRWAFANSNPGWNWINTGYTISTDKWTHIAVSYDQGLIKTYANGSLVHTYDGTGAIGDVVASQNEFRIGYRQAANSQYFKGEIDEVRVWNVAKTQSQIQANLNQKLSGKEQGLVGYWNFEEATGNTVNDLTTNKNNGTLINGVQRT
ncbi:MAG: lectin-like protein, partial [Nostocales cyanobacterium LE14-WE12]|nr:lectin-like protein [Nostocales cyanobacterium LE14-WE12]